MRAADGDGDGAINSLFAAVRAGRTMRGVFTAARSALFLNEIVGRTRPGRGSLERLARALGEADDTDDANLSRWFIEQRAGAINESHRIESVLGIRLPQNVSPDLGVRVGPNDRR